MSMAVDPVEQDGNNNYDVTVEGATKGTMKFYQGQDMSLWKNEPIDIYRSGCIVTHVISRYFKRVTGDGWENKYEHDRNSRRLTEQPWYFTLGNFWNLWPTSVLLFRIGVVHWMAPSAWMWSWSSQFEVSNCHSIHERLGTVWCNEGQQLWNRDIGNSWGTVSALYFGPDPLDNTAWASEVRVTTWTFEMAQACAGGIFGTWSHGLLGQDSAGGDDNDPTEEGTAEPARGYHEPLEFYEVPFRNTGFNSCVHGISTCFSTAVAGARHVRSDSAMRAFILRISSLAKGFDAIFRQTTLSLTLEDIFNTY